MIRGLECLSCEERLTELTLLNLERKMFWGLFIAAFWYLKGTHKKDRGKLLVGPVAVGPGLIILNQKRIDLD